MNPVQYLRIYKSTKSIMSLLDGIVYFYGRKQIFIIDYLADIIDMDKLYTYLKENYNIHLFYFENLKFDIKIIYGTPDSCVDLTSVFYNEKVFIPKDTDFKKYGDGKLYIMFIINGQSFQQIFDSLESDYVYEHQLGEICLNRVPAYNYDMQETIFRNIEYKEDILAKATLKYNTTLVNCLHIKIDDELIHNICSAQQKHPLIVKQQLETAYIQAIHAHFEKYDTIVVINYNKQIIDFLERENYAYELSEHYFDNKEKNTMVNYVRSKFCNHIFIGKEGSSLSYYIGLNVKHKVLV